MLKKFLVFFGVVLLLGVGAFVMYWELVRPDNYAVFIEAIQHGTVTVEGYEKTGSDDSYRIVVPNGEKITLAISPEVTDSTYYVLRRLLVNGADVTDSVDMLKYTTPVTSKLSILAYFSAADRPSEQDTKTSLTMPSLRVKKANAQNPYLGSTGAYGLKDPGVCYDSLTGYYYCFASENRVSRSKDLVNWESMGTYFKPMSDDTNDESIMDFSKFDSVYDWSLEHGYSKKLSVSDENNNRVPTSPDVFKIGNYYYLYFSVRKSAQLNEAAIFCVRARSLEDAILTHTWEDVGLVLCTCADEKENGKTDYDEVCAEHPSLFMSKDKRLYMAYGSYFGKSGEVNGSIYLVELDSATGLLKSSSAVNVQGDSIGARHGGGGYHSGVLLAKPGRVPALSRSEGSLVSGVDVLYNSATEYYYMFITYGARGSNENIRVLRSQSPEGVYMDYTGLAGNSASFRKDQLDVGTKLIGGYTFTSSDTAGVNKNELGRTCAGSPSMLSISGSWYAAMHSSVFSENGASAGGEDGDMFALDIRKVIFTDDGWPLLSCEPYSGEKIQNVKQTEMYGVWDVVVLDKRAGEESLTAVENSKSFKTTVFEGVAITQNDIDKNTKLSSLSFEYVGKYTYRIKLDSVEYIVYAVAAYDSELGRSCVSFTGISEDGVTVWGKKSIAPNVGLYTDAFDYALGQAGSELSEKYNKKLEAVGDSPTQSDINTLAASLVKEILA